MLHRLHELTKPLSLLHYQLSRGPLNPFISIGAFFAKVASYTDAKTAGIICRDIQNHVQLQTADLAAYAVFLLYPFHNNEISWPIVQWQEQNGREALAIFDIAYRDEEDWMSSYIIHFGVNKMVLTARWSRRELVWNATSMHALKALFNVAQHGAGILTLPQAIARRVYCHADSSDVEPDE